MSKYVYTMRRVSKTVPPQRAILRNISLNFFPGAKIGVLGLNGSGKSTLLRIMAGGEQNYEGEVIRMPNIRVGFLPQEPQLEAQRSVRDCVEEGLGDIGVAKKRLVEVYAAYSEPDADFDQLAEEQARLEAIMRSSAFSIFAHVSRKVTVRLKTSAFGFESRSTQKYPCRSNWNRSPAFAVFRPGSTCADVRTSSEPGLTGVPSSGRSSLKSLS